MKLDRAKLRMKELDSLLQSFRSTQPYKFSTKPEPRYGTVISMDEVAPVPDEISLVAGDVLQNLRSALDHLAYQLYLKGGGCALERQDMCLFRFTRANRCTTPEKSRVRTE
jgi:hypothetical protein